MARTIGIGVQDFGKLRENDYFYVDKTSFLKEWWESGDEVTLITRPRRFGKTLTMSMAEQFFSIKYAGRGDLFEGLSIWQEESYRNLQGSYPVICLSFANVKGADFPTVSYQIRQILMKQYEQNRFLLEGDKLSEAEKAYYNRMAGEMENADVSFSLYHLSDFLCRYYGKKVIILLDEYDTPMQEAYVEGYWKELVSLTRSMFNAAFKTNPWLERAIMTGITRVSKESIFSDLNNLKVVTTTSNEYATAFGFTEEEVFASMDEFHLTEKQKVKDWYDGFTFGDFRDIYNPWSILNYLDTGKVKPYWANTSSNSLVGKLIREGSGRIKSAFEELLKGGRLTMPIDEQIVYNQLDQDERAIWSLLLASGYLKVVSHQEYDSETISGMEVIFPEYELELTNFEVRVMFQNMVRGWFGRASSDYNDFLKALLLGDIDAMNEYMNRVAMQTFSFFDTGGQFSRKAEPERFYHGFVLGLMVELSDRYEVISNRESGFGRYDILLKPRQPKEAAFIIEFKVHNPRREQSLKETVEKALEQIEEKQYAAELLAAGIPKEHIKKYGFAFEGKTVLIG